MRRFLFIVTLLFAASCLCAAPVFTVKGTKIYKDGKEFRTVGVNMWNLFLEYAALDDSVGRQSEETHKKELGYMQSAADNGFNVIRFAASGFYPYHIRDWGNNLYFEAMDDIFDYADSHGIYLIPVISWNPCLFPDVANGSLTDLMRKKDSYSRKAFDSYTYRMVNRYKDRKCIFCWEISNELNLGADLGFLHPDGYEALNATWLGSTYMRTPADNYTSQDLNVFFEDVAKFVKKIDPDHLISTGNSVPRSFAYNICMTNNGWDKEDNVKELAEYFKLTHPDPIDLISIHYYNGDAVRFGNKSQETASKLREIKKAADKAGKPIYIGETHPGKPGKEYKPGDPFFDSLVKEVIRNRYPMVLMWVWGIPGDPAEFDPEATPELVKLMRDVNERMKK